MIGTVITVFLINPTLAKNQQIQPYNNKNNKTVLTVGYLTAMKGELKDKQGLAISGALTMALDEVSNQSKLKTKSYNFKRVICNWVDV